MGTDDKSGGGDWFGITFEVLEGALLMARMEPRASISCAIAVLHEAFMQGAWTQDARLRTFMRHVVRLNTDAGIMKGMTDDEARIWSNMVATLEGGAA